MSSGHFVDYVRFVSIFDRPDYSPAEAVELLSKPESAAAISFDLGLVSLRESGSPSLAQLRPWLVEYWEAIANEQAAPLNKARAMKMLYELHRDEQWLDAALDQFALATAEGENDRGVAISEGLHFARERMKTEAVNRMVDSGLQFLAYCETSPAEHIEQWMPAIEALRAAVRFGKLSETEDGSVLFDSAARMLEVAEPWSSQDKRIYEIAMSLSTSHPQRQAATKPYATRRLDAFLPGSVGEEDSWKLEDLLARVEDDELDELIDRTKTLLDQVAAVATGE